METILTSGPTFEDDEHLEEDVASIEVSISERKYSDLHYSETGTNQNNRMDQERGWHNGFQIYMNQKNQKNQRKKFMYQKMNMMQL